MKNSRGIWTCIISVVAMCVLILDSKTALSGAREGLVLCLNTVVPALFPFFVISAIMNSGITGKKFSALRPLGNLCGIPQGCESLLLLGLLGGYPVGAQAVYDAYHSKKINANTAKRLLGFCSNAGPSFIFGILSSQFRSGKIVWFIWGIHILSAISVGAILPNKQLTAAELVVTEPLPLPKALEKAIKTTGTVCGWVIIFRMLITVCSRWLFWLFPTSWRSVLTGILELTNGCCNLLSIPMESERFLISCCLLSFGGLCVMLQTISVTKDLGIGMYISGKLLQTMLSLILAGILQQFLYSGESNIPLPFLIAAGIILLLLVLGLRCKKSSSIMKKCVV